MASPCLDRKRSATDDDDARGSSIAKRQCVNNNNNNYISFLNLSPELRVSILQYATIEDLASFAMTARQCREDCRDPSLSQTRVATLDCKRSRDFRQALRGIQTAASGSYNKFRRFNRLKLVNHAGITKVTSPEASVIIRRLQLSATSLDLSLPASVLQAAKKQQQVPACVPKFLSKIMPHLRDVDLSYVSVAQSALSDFARNCPQLERLSWNHCDSSHAFASGQDLKNCRNLKELYMDHYRFYLPTDGIGMAGTSSQHENKMFEDPNAAFYPLYWCIDNLERVSLLHATYYVFGQKQTKKSFTQIGLMKFVRAAANLRWLRSDLTPENVSILQQERPEITFI